MAEFYNNDNLAYDDFDYVNPSPTEEQTLDDEIILLEAIDPKLPKRKLAKISKVEKLIYLLIMLVAVIFAFAIVYSITTVQRINNENAIIKEKNEKLKESVAESKQKVEEMLQSDRIKDIAEKKGLAPIDGNLRKIK